MAVPASRNMAEPPESEKGTQSGGMETWQEPLESRRVFHPEGEVCAAAGRQDKRIKVGTMHSLMAGVYLRCTPGTSRGPAGRDTLRGCSIPGEIWESWRSRRRRRRAH